jgi:hypothetical protein
MAGKQADIKVGVITNYDDKGIKQAQTGLGNFKSKIDEADGAGGKLKAGFNGVKESLIANAGAIGVAAGGAIVAFGIKAVGAFTDTAKAALDLQSATGLSIDEASRWIAIGDDMGVKAGELESSIGKIGKTLDSGKWDKYGIATHDAGGQARSTNDILLDAIDTLGKIDNKTERARVGNDLFGKGYASLSPLIGRTREEMEGYLGAVEDGQVITDEEAEKAEKFRLAQDELKDALHEVTLQVGEQVAELAPLLEGFAKLVGLYGDLGYLNPLKQAGAALDGLSGIVETFTHNEEEATLAAEGNAVSMLAAEGAARALGSATDDGTAAAEGTAIALAASKGATDALKTAQEQAKEKADAFAKSLQGQIDKLDALYPKEYDAVTAKYEYARQTEETMLAVDGLNTTLGNNKATQEEVKTATDNAKDAIIQQSEQFATLDGAALGSQGAIARQIESLETQRDTLAPGSPLRTFLDQYIADLAAIPSNISTIMDLHISQGSVTTRDGDVIGVRSGRHAGGGQQGMGSYGVGGEYGAELVTPGANVRNPAETRDIMSRGGNPMNVTIQVAMMPTGPQLVALLKTYDKNNATNIVTPAGR